MATGAVHSVSLDEAIEAMRITAVGKWSQPLSQPSAFLTYFDVNRHVRQVQGNLSFGTYNFIVLLNDELTLDDVSGSGGKANGTNKAIVSDNLIHLDYCQDSIDFSSLVCLPFDRVQRH